MNGTLIFALALFCLKMNKEFSRVSILKDAFINPLLLEVHIKYSFQYSDIL